VPKKKKKIVPPDERPIEINDIVASAGDRELGKKINEMLDHLNKLTMVVYHHLNRDEDRENIGYISDDEELD